MSRELNILMLRSVVGTIYRDKQVAQEGAIPPPFDPGTINARYATVRFRNAPLQVPMLLEAKSIPRMVEATRLHPLPMPMGVER